ncbi:MAG: AAA family ATPase [Lachnotalea sp.]
MEKYAVTITRQFGSLGRPIAVKLAELLEVEYFDRDIVEESARKMNLPVSVIGSEEETVKTNFWNMMFPLGQSSIEIQEQIFETQRKIILDLAEKQTCIIVGRCSDFILEGYENHISIYIYSSYEARLRNCVETLLMKEEDARRMIAKVDKARDAYHMRYAKYHPEDIRHKDMLIDSSLLGVDGTAILLAELIRSRMKQ